MPIIIRQLAAFRLHSHKLVRLLLLDTTTYLAIILQVSYRQIFWFTCCYFNRSLTQLYASTQSPAFTKHMSIIIRQLAAFRLHFHNIKCLLLLDTTTYWRLFVRWVILKYILIYVLLFQCESLTQLYASTTLQHFSCVLIYIWRLWHHWSSLATCITIWCKCIIPRATITDLHICSIIIYSHAERSSYFIRSFKSIPLVWTTNPLHRWFINTPVPNVHLTSYDL